MTTQPETGASNVPADALHDFEAWQEVSEVATDRYCDGCGYNLNKQRVRREPHTQVLVIRCPECARFHPASDASYRLNSWMRKLAVVVMVFWAVSLISAALSIGMVQGFLTYITLDEFTTHERVSISATNFRYEPRLNQHTWGNVEVRHQLYAITGSMSLGLGFVATLIAIAVAPHWRWYHHVVFTVAWAIGAGAIVALIWWYEATLLFRWGLERITAQAGIYILGGLIAMLVGRYLIKLAARICLTPRMRVVIEGAWARLETGRDRA